MNSFLHWGNKDVYESVNSLIFSLDYKLLCVSVVIF